MGLRDLGRRALDWVSVAPALELAAGRAPRPVRWGFDTYAPVDQVISQMWDGAGRVSQDEALAVPGVLRARNIIAGGLSSWPLVLMDAQNRVSRTSLLTWQAPSVECVNRS